jgi:hypothetical protein
MRKLLNLACSLFLFSLQVSGAVVRGTLLNDDDPYIIKGNDGSIYKAEWYSGSILFYEGDEVILTNDYGHAQMVNEDQDEVADVLVEEISEGYSRIIPRPMPTPLTPATSYSTPTLSPAPAPPATPTRAPRYNDAKWPDGRILAHPEHPVSTGVVNVRPNDTLKLRAGPGTTYNVVAAIPADATGISAFDKDAVWDGDTWWYPVEWQGLRGYVSGSYLPHDH